MPVEKIKELQEERLIKQVAYVYANNKYYKKLMDDKGKICLEKAKLVAYCHGEYYSLGEMLGFFGYSVASKEALKRRMPVKKSRKSNKK